VQPVIKLLKVQAEEEEGLAAQVVLVLLTQVVLVAILQSKVLQKVIVQEGAVVVAVTVAIVEPMPNLVEEEAALAQTT
jgi:hypothetical protein